jgi:hypothetical protein
VVPVDAADTGNAWEPRDARRNAKICTYYGRVGAGRHQPSGYNCLSTTRHRLRGPHRRTNGPTALVLRFVIEIGGDPAGPAVPHARLRVHSGKRIHTTAPGTPPATHAQETSAIAVTAKPTRNAPRAMGRPIRMVRPRLMAGPGRLLVRAPAELIAAAQPSDLADAGHAANRRRDSRRRTGHPGPGASAGRRVHRRRRAGAGSDMDDELPAAPPPPPATGPAASSLPATPRTSTARPEARA